MNNTSLHDMRRLEDLARLDTFVHRRHPVVKLLTTLAFLGVVVSFGRYEIGPLLPLVFYPVVVLSAAEIPAVPLLKRVLWAAPLILGVGVLNPLLEHGQVLVGGLALSRGWLTFLSLSLKSLLTVTAALLLIATTGMENVAAALRSLGVPRLFVLQLLLTYRYISVLGEEVERTLKAYALRAPGQHGVQRAAWGSMVGQLLLRTVDRAERVYQAMCLRGFAGEYHGGAGARISATDLAYGLSWGLFFAIARVYDIPALLGALTLGGWM
ncbi:MAG: cobalt ECF transporter T component CbiQ [Syntrophomonadaceae bacterium]|nr:cobalt ECF transporter T component CbiQ [Syntrophomonadaceae bacterium]MDH7497567.1 cobalt ECF transporter T component CbiQ [Syntrophomonadaceae bacterium]